MDRENIEEILSKLGADDVPAEIHQIAEETSQKFSETLTQSRQHILWENIMKMKVTKLAAAAVIIIAVIVGIDQLGGSIDGTSVAWGDVISRVAKVDYVHFLFMPEPKYHRVERPYEGWYNHGKVVRRSWLGRMFYDDGKIAQGFDRNNTLTYKGPSNVKGQFFSWVSEGLLKEDNEQFREQVPTYVGDDFLIYKFYPSEENSYWKDSRMKSVSITVSRNSLLPVQIKTYYEYDYFMDGDEGLEEDGYTMLIFDYDAFDKHAEFFEPPTISNPFHGTGEIVLNGEEVMIDVSSSRDIKTMVMRLYSEDFLTRPPVKYKLQPKHFAEISFILKNGVRSITAPDVALWVNHAGKLGMGDVDNWPDKKYRNISATLVLRPTEKEGIYMVEVNCWLDTIRGDGDI